MPTLLLTGFGPFPGAPFNPTVKLVRQLARLRRPALADIKVVPHIFETSYAAVDRELPALIAKHKPDAILMFGLHGRAKTIRVETRARNALALLPDASGKVLRRGTIAPNAASSLAMHTPARALLAAARSARVKVVPSRDAGRYLCNYLCWRATEAVTIPNGPRLAAFVHVPLVRRPFSVRPRESGDPGAKELDSRFPPSRSALRRTQAPTRRSLLAKTGRGNERRFTAADLFRAGQHILVALAAAVNRA